MSLNYDECLDQNPFYRAIQENHTDIIDKATEEQWIICVPRTGTITTITTEDILEHVLVPNIDLPHTHFCTLTKHELSIQDKLILLRNNEAVRILFEETFYISKNQKYKLWCIERPLHRCLENCEDYTCIRTLQDCIKLLWSKESSVLDDINKVIEKFLGNECEFNDLESLQHEISSLFLKCIERTSSNLHDVQSDYANLSVESYMQHCIHHKLFRAVCNCTWQADSKFNKLHRNYVEIQLKDLEISNEFFERILRAKREVSCINKFTTVLDKIECLQRAVNTLSSETNYTQSCGTITTEVLLKIFVFLIIKSNLNNWISNFVYITHFRFSAINLSDENSFLLTTLEAAIECIKSETFCCKAGYDLNSIKSLPNFFSCIRGGNLEAIKEFFDGKLIIKASCCHPLCSCDKCESVTDFNLNSCDDKGRSALHMACLYGHPHIVEYLIGKSVEIDRLDYAESTPLHYAARKGNQNALLLLLHASATIDPRDCDGNTPLHVAANNGHENCVKALLYFSEQCGNLLDINLGNNMKDTALHFAAKWAYLGIARILLQYGADIKVTNKRNQKVLDVIHNDQLARLLLTSSVEHHKQDAPNHVQVPEEATIRPKSFYLIKKTDLALKSIENNDLPLMCYYLGIPTPPSAISLIARTTCHPLCTCDTCTKHFESPAIITSSDSSEALNINTCNSEGFSPLHTAAKYDRVDILRLLLDSGALVNVRTYKHLQTPLHLACRNQRGKIVRELLQCGGCNVDMRDAKGNTPLHYACLNNDSRVVEMLLSHGSDYNIKNCEGKTPLQEAKGRMLYNIVTLLNGKGEGSDWSETVTDLFSF